MKRLKEWDCDVDGALERFIGDEELYQSCLYTVLEDKAFDGLGEALAAEKPEEAFDHAHTLKGVLANMGLTPMLNIVVQLVEPLRDGNCKDLLPVYEQLLKSKEHLKEIVG